MEYPGFMQLLGQYPERSETWKLLHASLLVVRLAHAAFHDLEAGPDGLRVVRRAIRRLADLRDQRQLDHIVALANATAVDWSAHDALSGKLLGYGITLHELGHREAVIDVCSILTDSPIDDRRIGLSALQRRAFAFRDSGQFDDAERDYHTLHDAARVQGEMHMRRQADLGLAKVAIERGNFQAAVPMLEELRDEAREAPDRTLLGLTLLDLAALTGLRKDYSASLAYSEEALQFIADASQRERCYVNMARAARDLGDTVRAAQYAALVRETGIHADMRARAGVILYLVAIDTQNAVARDAARQWLEGEALPPSVECDFREAVAYAHAVEGAFEAAVSAVGIMLGIAERHRYGEMINRGDEALVDLRRRRVPSMYFGEIRSVAIREPIRRRPFLRAAVGHTSATAENIPTGARLILTRSRRL